MCQQAIVKRSHCKIFVAKSEECEAYREGSHLFYMKI